MDRINQIIECCIAKQSFSWRGNLVSILLAWSCMVICGAFVLQDYKHIKTIGINGKFLTTDNLNNCYVVTDANELVKFDGNGDRQFAFSEKGFGKLSFVDASNPLKILAFYPEFSTIIALDKTLSPIGNYNLQKIGIFRIGTICLSQDNNIWVYDEQDFRLKKIDVSMKIIQQSDDLNLLLQKNLKPNLMMERNNFIFMNDSTNGVLQFDNYATYFKTIPIKGIISFQLMGDRIFYFKENNFKSYNLFKLEEQTVLLPDSTGLLQTRIEKERFYLLKKNQLNLYSF